MTAVDSSALCKAMAESSQGLIVVVTGAGISLASGISTFRGTDPDAVWHRDVTELGTLRFFQSDPVASWQWYMGRFDSVLDKHPNAAHHALKHLERWQLARGGEFLLVTQNVDTLHEMAGSQSMIKVHGSADKVRCSRYGCENGAPGGHVLRSEIDMQPFLSQPSVTTLPKCGSCGELLRQHVLWFDEYYDEHESYKWPRVIDAARTMQLCLFVGTSFSVGVTELFLRNNPSARRFSIDPGAVQAPAVSVQQLHEPAELALPQLCADLGIDCESP